ncbi:type II toxin-antitoxin system PemK/MazF family toxin [Phormidesmis sp. 146-12]
MSIAKRGEIWLVNLNPTRGQEIQKTRPAVVVSSNVYGAIAMRIVIPIATWQDKFSTRPFMVRIPATSENGLDLDSAGNVLQVRSVSTERFVSRIGRIELDRLKELLAGLVICVEYDPEA